MRAAVAQAKQRRRVGQHPAYRLVIAVDVVHHREEQVAVFSLGQIIVGDFVRRASLAGGEVAYDYLTEAENRYLFFPVVNYVYGDHEPIREMLTDSGTLLGLSDGGAHCASIIDAGVPTYMLLHWGRDRRRGPRLPLELLVKR